MFGKPNGKRGKGRRACDDGLVVWHRLPCWWAASFQNSHELLPVSEVAESGPESRITGFLGGCISLKMTKLAEYQAVVVVVAVVLVAVVVSRKLLTPASCRTNCLRHESVRYDKQRGRVANFDTLSCFAAHYSRAQL